MLSHAGIWTAIDLLAARHDLSPSGLARRAGLDPTTFNRSKRTAPDGRPRWPSTESIAKILEATGARLDDFVALLNGRRGPADAAQPFRQVPLLGFAQAGTGGFFDDGGFPAGIGWDEVPFPAGPGEAVYALEVSGDSMLPLYRDGDVVIVAPAAPCRRGDRVVVRTREGEVMAKTLIRRTQKQIELGSLNPEHGNRTLAVGEIDWIARIVWASQ
jgi:phage repressor protein C with HTH and peptisase S24 domain